MFQKETSMLDVRSNQEEERKETEEAWENVVSNCSRGRTCDVSSEAATLRYARWKWIHGGDSCGAKKFFVPRTMMSEL